MEIITVKIQQNGYLLNGMMFVPQADGNKEYEAIKEWLSEGNTPEPEFTEEELQAELKVELKAQIAKQLEELTVTTAKGNTFDANSQARLDISNGILVSQALGVTETVWRMADDKELLVTVDELKEALALALQEYARVKGIGQ